MDYDITPKASSILSSLRSIGYDLQTALADIIDNSISASGKIIEIVNNDISEPQAKLEWLAIVDDGIGMSLEKIISAFVLGGDGVEQERNETDLGRFGLGLKTASFSQCKKLTVISKTKSTKIEALVFDLEYIVSNNNQWKAYKRENVEFVLEKIQSRLHTDNFFEKDSWTIILWENIDKIFFSNNVVFYSEMEKARQHFALIFHKFEKSIEIRFNKNKIDFWDPFLTATKSEEKKYSFDSDGNTYKVRTHVLRHSSEFKNDTEYKNQSKIGSFNQNQGFFVYRKNRLIFKGSWLGLFNKEHHYILARVEINLSNSFVSDNAWKVDISKSSVTIPAFAINDLINECNEVRSSANNTFRYHGGIIKHVIRTGKSVSDIQPIWNFETKGNKDGVKDHYLLNKEHPVIKSYTNSLSNDKYKIEQFYQVLKYIESYLPLDNIFARKANQDIEQPKQKNSDLYEKFKSIFNIYKEDMGAENAYETIINIEPFNSLSFDEEMLGELGIKYEKKI